MTAADLKGIARLLALCAGLAFAVLLIAQIPIGIGHLIARLFSTDDGTGTWVALAVLILLGFCFWGWVRAVAKRNTKQ